MASPDDPQPGREEQDRLTALSVAAEQDADAAPASALLRVRAAEACVTAGRVDAALAHATRAASLDPTGYYPTRVLSGILAVAGRREEAIAAARRAVALSPATSDARLHLGGLLLGAQAWKEAAEHLAIHVSLPGADPTAWHLLAVALHQAGAFDRAIDAAGRAVAGAPDRTEWRIHRASLLTERARYREALDEFAAALAQRPDDPAIHHAIGSIHELLGDLPKALHHAEAALSLAPDQPRVAENARHIRRLLGLAASDPHEDKLREDPASWGPRGRTAAPRPPRHRNSFARDVSERGRVIYALMLREIRTRFGHSRVGYLWAIVEPLLHLLTLGIVFALMNHGPAPVGENLFLYYLTGVVPYLLFAHLSNEMMEVIANNSSILHLPIVKRVDIMVSRGLLQLATEILAGIVAFSTAALCGLQGMPADPLTVAQAVACIWVLGMGVGAINLVIAEFSSAWCQVYTSMLRLLYFASGIYYSPIVTPEAVRNILVWNPILQGIEFFRSGFYRQYDPHWLDRGYLVTVSISALVIGFALERSARHHIRVSA